MALGFRPSLVLGSAALVALACGGSEFTQGQSGAGGTDVGAGGAPGGGGAHGGGSSTGGKSGGSGGVTGTGGRAGTGGGTGTGGIVGSGGVTTGGAIGAGGSTGGGCPSTLPTDGAPCDPDGLQCSFGQCCPSFASCHQGKWQVAIASCPQPTCPDSAPKNGDTCPCMLEGQSCDFNRCDIGAGYGTSTCSGGVWTVKDVGCPRPDYCAGYACPSSSVCMATVQGSSGNVSLSCVLRQCPDPTSPVCSCIGTACIISLGQCSPNATGTSAICDVP